jgi:glycerate kinase
VGQNGMDPFGQRLLDIQEILEATTIEELEAAGERLGRSL